MKLFVLGLLAGHTTEMLGRLVIPNHECNCNTIFCKGLFTKIKIHVYWTEAQSHFFCIIGGSKKSRFLIFSKQVDQDSWMIFMWETLKPVYVPSGEGNLARTQWTTQAGNTRLTPFPNLLCTQYANWVHASHLLVLQSKREYKVNSQMCMYTSDKKQLPLWLFVQSFPEF